MPARAQFVREAPALRLQRCPACADPVIRRLAKPPADIFHEVTNMTRHRPNDTRYPFAALAAGLIRRRGRGRRAVPRLVSATPSCLRRRLAGVFVCLPASIKYADQWEKAVLMRLGRYRGLRGPGYFAVVPILDRVAYTIDQRIRTTAFGAESCLTRDTVPVNVDAIAFWIVRDAERAALEVQDYDEAVILSRRLSFGMPSASTIWRS